MSHVPKTLSIALVVAALALLLGIDESFAQLATVTFPDTAVGSSSRLTCPTPTVGVCFGSNCSGSGTVQAVTVPSDPFLVGKFNRLSLSDFQNGLCESHPVAFPVTLAANQMLAYQAIFTPTAGGTFNDTLTFATSGGPATANLTGKGVAPRSDKGSVVILLDPEEVVPGGTYDLRYRLGKGALQGNVDLYVAVVVPGGQLFLVTENFEVVTSITPFRKNFSVIDTTVSLGSGRLPIDLAFGSYGTTCRVWYPVELENVARAIFEATYSYLPAASLTLGSILNDLRQMPLDEPVRFIKPWETVPSRDD